MAERILFVDDEANILAAFKRQLRNRFLVETAQSGQEGLSLIAGSEPFAIIMADFRMPGMDGIQFLTRVKDLSPDSVRMMLTGHADLTTSINAINEGHIFRFLTKPCPPETLILAIESGIEQHRLITAERELLEKTLSNSVRLLTELLSLANPLAFSQALRVRRIVKQITYNMKLIDSWQYELAAMLSQTGCVTLPSEILEKVNSGEPLLKSEKALFASHPQIGARLLENIPRLESIAQMVRDQQKPFSQYNAQNNSANQRKIYLGPQILKVALDYSSLIHSGLTHTESLRKMAENAEDYNPEVIKALGDHEIRKEAATIKSIDVNSVEIGMIVDQDVLTKDGKLVMTKDQEVTLLILERLRQLSQEVGIFEPIRMVVPSQPARPLSN
jgi:response regulator RpfG family c-di-GMP phosphodiesterase